MVDQDRDNDRAFGVQLSSEGAEAEERIRTLRVLQRISTVIGVPIEDFFDLEPNQYESNSTPSSGTQD